jgi:putative transcriptional regulator
MPIIVNLDVMLAKRKMTSLELAQRVGMTPANLSILKTGKAKAIRMSTLEAICRELQCQPGDLLEFREDGICRKLMRNGHETVRASCRYTAGYILNSQTEFAEQYEIRTLGGDDYLITEHKSGDYAYLGKVNCYFVFRRKTP